MVTGKPAQPWFGQAQVPEPISMHWRLRRGARLSVRDRRFPPLSCVGRKGERNNASVPQVTGPYAAHPPVPQSLSPTTVHAGRSHVDQPSLNRPSRDWPTGGLARPDERAGRDYLEKNAVAVSDLFQPLDLLHSPATRNRFMLAPLTNPQSEFGGAASNSIWSGPGSLPRAVTR